METIIQDKRPRQRTKTKSKTKDQDKDQDKGPRQRARQRTKTKSKTKDQDKDQDKVPRQRPRQKTKTKTEEVLITKKTTLSSTELYQEAERRYDELCRMRTDLEKTLVKYPEGSIHVIRNRGYVQYYLRKQSGQTGGEYLSKRQTDTIQIYLQKKYMQEVLRLLRSEMDSIEKFLRNCKPSQDKIRGLFSEKPEEIRKYLNPVDTSDADYIKAWSETAYEKKLISGTIPVFVTNKGEPVRSKSELIIANRLYDLQIPYKYECPVWLSGEKKIYPDFTVLNIRKRREIYWEHRGMMDGQEYANHSVQRMREYQQAGIYLGEGLIITEETSSVPLDTGEIDRVIQHYILNTY